MTSLRLVARGLRHFRWTHLAAFGATAVTAAVVVAALGVGDSVGASLEAVAETRTGRVAYAARARDRTWREEVATALAERLGADVAPAFLLNASVATPEGSRVARARVLGVDDRFWALSPGGRPPRSTWPAGGAAIGEEVAARLGLGVGDVLVVRAERPAAVPRDAPMASDSAAAVRLRVEVVAVVDAQAFGAFSLDVGQRGAANVFLPLESLQNAIGEEGRVNALLVGPGPRDLDVVAAAIAAAWRLDDAGLWMRRLDGDRGWQLTSRRVFVEPPAADAALAAPGAQGVLTWLVNDIAARERRTPYSLVSALPRGRSPVPHDLADDEIVLNEWLADDLGAAEGDEVTLTYYVVGEGRRLEERARAFRVRGIVPIEGAAADRQLMPAFPGLEEAESCRKWDPGFLLDLDRIRDEDEAYWDAYRGTPKAFVALEMGQSLWGNRFGALTAVRFPPGAEPADVATAIRARLDPAEFGLRFADVRSQSLAAREEGVDFGTLFLGFGGLLVIAALLLTGLVVALNVEMRQQEVATLRALGYAPARVRRLFGLEHGLVALAGGVAGAVGGIGLEAAALHSLGTVWRDVAGSLETTLAVRPGTLVGGALAGAAVSFGAAWLALWPALRRPVGDAFTRGEEEAARHARTRSRRCVGHGVALVFAVAAVVVAVRAGTGRDPATAGAFFGSGALLLCAALSFTWYALAHVGVGPEGRRMGRWGLAWRNLGRRRGRSLAVIGVLAFGVFMFLGVTVFRRDRLATPDDPASGTGGFTYVGESSVAVVQDLDTPEGRRFHALPEEAFENVRIVGLRVREGDDASCRSLERAQAPEVVGVKPEALAGRFAFVGGADGLGDPWVTLLAPSGDGTVPAVVDQATLWTLGRGLGDEVELTDEAGRPFTARIAGVIDNAVLHGQLVVSETAFKERYPSDGGYRRFLVDVPGPRRRRADVAGHLVRQLEDRGLALEWGHHRLNAYNAVENTYLAIFQALGGLGLLLGSLGLALVVGRNTVERRAELALLGAVGFGTKAIVRLVTAEHAVLLGLGLLAGLLAAALSLLPVLAAPGAPAATPRMGLVLGVLAAGGVLWTWVAARLALRGNLVTNLRTE